MTRYIPHFVGGKSLEPTGGRVADVFDPSTGEVQARVPLATADEVRAVIENAADAQPRRPQLRLICELRRRPLGRRPHAKQDDPEDDEDLADQ